MINIQHNCQQKGCTLSRTRYIRQERTQTVHTAPVVGHLRNPGDLILNTAQMWDAVYLQRFRIPSTPLDEEAEVLRSVMRVIDQRKVIVDGTGLTHGPGRGGLPCGSSRGGLVRG